MATVTIRSLEPATIETLKAIAADHGRSMEAEIRAILTETTRRASSQTKRRLGDEIHARFKNIDTTDLAFERNPELARDIFEQ
ncbi:FitA-like ribbon-helix-helix domain-containing protein [Subtercola lobariae]|uniref:Antitoxin FitA-like ribbon-helix-helix domain-containing protein n=1 Tax=Subtercola lobariae TaxID=1588641 RepID=A0A917BBK3_9MICO|nr:plasmid stabilization protein [Subtercola lobariae]GGF32722.1 hypothetical protein GCM10011399_27340 [Subtercola lobariae]